MVLIIGLIGLLCGWIITPILKKITQYQQLWISYYPWIQSITWIVIYNKFSYSFDLVKYIFFASFLLLLAIIDQCTKYIFMLPMIIAGVIAIIFALTSRTLIDSLAGGILGYILIFFIIKYSDEGMGEGDRDLVGICGLFLGFKSTYLMICLSFIIGALTIISLLLLKKRSLRDEIAFVPFIYVATILTLLFQEKLLILYQEIIYYLTYF